MTTRLPVSSIANPPISQPCRPWIALTSGASPTILTSFSPSYRCWNSSLMSREDICLLSGMLTV